MARRADSRDSFALDTIRAPAYLRDLAELRAVGADSVITGEVEVALALTEEILRRLGATPEQIDRERSRAHSEMFADASAASGSSAEL